MPTSSHYGQVNRKVFSNLFGVGIRKISMKKHLASIAIILSFALGLALLLYPYIADRFNAHSQSRAVASHRNAVRKMDSQDLTEYWEAARNYNKELLSKESRFVFSDEDRSEYQSLLNASGSGIMGILEIAAIGVRLPIYHGTSEAVLQLGIGHFEGSSLPVGGSGTHCAVTGHRGLPASTLLTKLDRVVPGDTFALQILDEYLWYQVDQINVVSPEDLSNLEIDPNMDYCTIITCTPYGINSQRLLVRGIRVDE